MSIHSFECREVYMAYYPRLKELREDNDYTQQQIAEILFITQQQYSLYVTKT